MFKACSNVIFIVSLRSAAPASNKLVEDKFDNGENVMSFYVLVLGKNILFGSY